MYSFFVQPSSAWQRMLPLCHWHRDGDSVDSASCAMRAHLENVESSLAWISIQYVASPHRLLGKYHRNWWLLIQWSDFCQCASISNIYKQTTTCEEQRNTGVIFVTANKLTDNGFCTHESKSWLCQFCHNSGSRFCMLHSFWLPNGTFYPCSHILCF